MTQTPFPDPGPDDAEPVGSPLPPEDEGATGQGLYLCLPQDQVTLAGFAQHGQADTMAPGPLLATIVDTVTGEDGGGLAGCSEDQLVGVISAARRMEARAAWTLMTAVAEFAARHAAGTVEDEFAADELAFGLHLTPLSAADQMHYATMVRTRLPETFAALYAGRIHPVHVRIIEDETRVLSDADAARADRILAGLAAGMTFGELRAAAHKLVLTLDPEAAKKRKEAARAQAHVRPFRERSGNAGMVARELPSDEVLASFQHVEQRALDLRAAGLPGSLRELRIRAYLDLLQERDSRTQPATPDANAAAPAPDPGGALDQQPADDDPPDTGPDDPGDGPSDPSGPGHGSRGRGGPGPAPNPAPPSGPTLAAAVNITVPWSASQGQPGTGAEMDGFGLVDSEDTRDLLAAAARDPRTRWCVTHPEPRRHRRRPRLPPRPPPPLEPAHPAPAHPAPARHPAPIHRLARPSADPHRPRPLGPRPCPDGRKPTVSAPTCSGCYVPGPLNEATTPRDIVLVTKALGEH
jgi:Domain of unknown function (DUF222)